MAMDYSISGSANMAGSDDIAKRIAQITSQNTPFMQQARTTGLQQANQRGLSNSSMAVGASQAESMRAAAPIASQEANLAAAAREAQLGAMTNLSGQRMNAIAATMQNPDLPADARIAVLRSYNDQFAQIANYLQNLYGSRLNQNAPSSPSAPSAPPIMAADYGGAASAYMPRSYDVSQLRGLSLA
jgi:hypothetical protein